MTNPNLKQLEGYLDYQFTNSDLLETALTHRSYLNESAKNQSNERLEFLGDAVLELLTSHHLYQHRPNDPEGILTAARAALVRTESLADIATNLHLGDFLHLSRGEEQGGGRINPSLLANTFEAVLGAVYLDGGYSAASDFVSAHLLPQADRLTATLKAAKSPLQETVQELGYPSPTYTTISQVGPDHDKHFQVAVFAGSRQLAEGVGKSKQAAQQAAAEAGLDNLPPQLVK